MSVVDVKWSKSSSAGISSKKFPKGGFRLTLLWSALALMKILTIRSWVILDEENRFIAMKHEPRLALTKSSFHGNQLWIEAPDMPTLKLSYIEDVKDADVVSFR